MAQQPTNAAQRVAQILARIGRYGIEQFKSIARVGGCRRTGFDDRNVLAANVTRRAQRS